MIILLSGCAKDLLQPDTEFELQRIAREHQLPSLAAGIFKDDSMVWSQTFGYGNIQTKNRATVETIYHIGSISKLFVVTAIMILEEQGKIDLDEDINLYLPVVLRHPDFPGIPITARMLLTHRAGLSWPQSYDSEQGMWNEFAPDQAPSPSMWIPQFLLPSGDNYDANLWKPLEPGCCEFYTNISFCIVAYLVEQISKQDFREYCRQHIFIPLNMKNTSYDYTDLDQENIAVLYSQQGRPTYSFDNRVYAAGGAKSTIGDLGRFAACYMNKGLLHGERILEVSSIDKILEIQNEASGRCLAWKKSLGDWFGHTGGLVLGTTATLDIHLHSKTAAIVITNTHSNLVVPGGDIFGFVRNKANQYIE